MIILILKHNARLIGTLPFFVLTLSMPRVARVVFPGVPHHVTQQGNRREEVFFEEEDRSVCLAWLREYSKKHNVCNKGCDKGHPFIGHPYRNCPFNRWMSSIRSSIRSSIVSVFPIHHNYEPNLLLPNWIDRHSGYLQR